MVLDLEKRKIIKLMGDKGCSVSDIAQAIGVQRQTIYYEFQRNGMDLQNYNPEQAQQQAEIRKAKKNRSVLDFEKRKRIKLLADEGYCISVIARSIGVSHFVITNELKRNDMTLKNYDPEIAQKRCGKLDTSTSQ